MNFFRLNENETCSNNDRNKSMFNETEENCSKIFDDRIFDKSSKINLFIRFRNRSNCNEDLISQLIEEINEQLKFNHCISLKTKQVLLWKDLFQQDSLLFDQMNLILDIKQLNIISFEYDLVVRMPNLKDFSRKLQMKIDHSYLSRHQHPAEQIVEISSKIESLVVLLF